jgi:hypothetical protein
MASGSDEGQAPLVLLRNEAGAATQAVTNGSCNSVEGVVATVLVRSWCFFLGLVCVPLSACMATLNQ